MPQSFAAPGDQIKLADAVIDYLGACPISVNGAAKLCGIQRATVDRSVELVPILFSYRQGDFRSLREVIRATIQSRKGDLSSDRRNMAQAEKAEVETGILEKRFRPVEEFREVFTAFHVYVAEILKTEKEMPEALRKRIMDRFNLLCEEWENAAKEEI